MATEERILAKIEQLKKQREDAAIEAAIEKEALRRLEEEAFQIENEKLEQAILYGDINTIRVFAMIGRRVDRRVDRRVGRWPGDRRQTFWKNGCKIITLAVKARKFLDEREAEQKKAAEEQEQRFRIAREAFDRAELAAMSLKSIVFQADLLKDMINQTSQLLLNSSYMISEVESYKAQCEQTVNQAKLAYYEAELDRRRLDDKDLVEDRVINASLEKQQRDEEYQNSAEGRRRMRELATIGCCPTYKSAPLPPHTVSKHAQEVQKKWFAASG